MNKRLIYITAYSAGLVATQTKRYRRKISFKNQNLVLKLKHEVTRVLSTWESNADHRNLSK